MSFTTQLCLCNLSAPATCVRKVKEGAVSKVAECHADRYTDYANFQGCPYRETAKLHIIVERKGQKVFIPDEFSLAK